MKFQTSHCVFNYQCTYVSRQNRVLIYEYILTQTTTSVHTIEPKFELQTSRTEQNNDKIPSFVRRKTLL